MSGILAVALAVGLASPAEDSHIPSRMMVRAFRLGPGADLKKERSRFARENGLRAGIVLTCA